MISASVALTTGVRERKGRRFGEICRTSCNAWMIAVRRVVSSGA
jgi:hypothetical protein